MKIIKFSFTIGNCLVLLTLFMSQTKGSENYIASQNSFLCNKQRKKEIAEVSSSECDCIVIVFSINF